MSVLDVDNRISAKMPIGLLRRAADIILGKKYELSLVICGDALSRSLNKRHRGKNKITNVLSFPLSKSSGEIFLNPRQATRESKNFGRTHKNHLIALFIHGLLHLKGFDHGQKMDKREVSFKRQLRLRY